MSLRTAVPVKRLWSVLYTGNWEFESTVLFKQFELQSCGKREPEFSNHVSFGTLMPSKGLLGAYENCKIFIIIS
jgi:hypothetical protein